MSQSVLDPPRGIDRDVHSFSDLGSIRVSHVALDLVADFDACVLEGHAILNIRAGSKKNRRLILDTRQLSIRRTSISSDGLFYSPTRFVVGPADSILGSPLEILVRPDTSHVDIEYSTHPDASALQWLNPEQTATKQFPFLFTQSQEIHARSWIPIQDSPSVRMTFSARIRVPKDLVAVMGAELTRSEPAEGLYEFRMEQSVPAYLVALAVGKLEFAQTGPRTGVYAEPPLLAAAAFEFSDVEHMIRTTESLYGPYQWGRFDLLVLPPSFPFGGMENPRVPFITPTLIAGDKSLVALVTHELAHSWSGNLVSNATWSDFWLNEGFTTYIERRIQELLYGRERAEMEEVLERETLESDILTLDPCDQVLHIELTGRDPDEGSTSVPYVKGSLFLRTLEELYGRSRLDNFLRSYFKHFAFQSITTQRAMDFLDRNLLSKNPNLARQISLDEWINKPGLPSSAPVTRSDAFAKVERLARNWFLGELLATDLHTEEWSAQELQHFLHSFPGHITARKLAELDEKFQLTNTHNSETLVRWLVLAIRNDYKPAFNRLEKFLLGVGRRKYLKLLYTELVKTPENRQLAKFIYAKARASYHPITRMTIDNLLLGIDGT